MPIKPENFTHLHAHSCYSLKDGSIPIRTLVDRQVQNGSRAVACTDHGNMTSAWFLYDYIHNVKGYQDVAHIIGCELYLSTTRKELFDWLPIAKEDEPDKDKRNAKRKLLAKKYHQIILCKNETGYYNAVKVHNEAWKNGFYYSPATTKEFLFENSEGLIVTTTCLASLWCQKIIAGDLNGAEREIREWKEVFGEDFYVELQPTTSKEQILVNRELIKLAQKTGTRMIVTNDVHYIDHELHYTLLNLGNLKKEAEGQGTQKMWEFDVNDLYIKSLDDMKCSWKETHRSKEFTESVFDGCIMAINDIVDSIEHYTLESTPLLPTVDDQDPLELLKKQTVEGFKEKVKKGLVPAKLMDTYQDRIIEELDVISALGAENYINICALITSWCRSNNIGVGVGRGSAAGSLVLYLLGVTDVDPIKHNLLFARFLNMNRRPKLIM